MSKLPPFGQLTGHRRQVADLILKDEKNNNLVICSPLDKNSDGSMSFLVGEDSPEGARYKVTIKIEEV